MILHPPEPTKRQHVDDPVTEDAPLRRDEVGRPGGRAVRDQPASGIEGALVPGHQVSFRVVNPVRHE